MVRKTVFSLAIVLWACTQLSVAYALSEFPSTLVVVISGRGSDASADQISNRAQRGSGNSGMYQLIGDLRNAGFKTIFFNWNGTDAGQFTEKDPPGAAAIVAAIRRAYTKDKIKHLVLVGHSWGGHTMLEVALELNSEPTLKIELAIGIDASSFGRGERTSRLPANIAKLICFHTRNAFTWGAWKDETRVEDIDLGNTANGFMKDGEPNYAAAFDRQAHNAVEWDQRVHAEVLSRIKKAVAGQRSSGLRATELR